MIAGELLEANHACTARGAMRENRTPDSAKTNYADIVRHGGRKNFRRLLRRAMVVFVNGEASCWIIVVACNRTRRKHADLAVH